MITVHKYLKGVNEDFIALNVFVLTQFTEAAEEESGESLPSPWFPTPRNFVFGDMTEPEDGPWAWSDEGL